MAGPGQQFDVNAARQAGATDDQILQYLTQRSPGFDVDGALRQSSKAQVIDYLSTHASAPAGVQPAAPEQPGFFRRLGQSLGVPTSGEELESAITPVKIGRVPIAPKMSGLGMVAGYVGNVYDHARELLQHPELGPALKAVMSLTPAGGSQESFGTDIANKNYAGAAGTATGIIAQAAAPELVKRGGEALNRMPGPYAKRMAQRPTGSEFTRGEVLNYARQNGVNLDLADATGSPALGAIKTIPERSIAGRGAISRNVSNNLQALDQTAAREAGQYAAEPMEREALGQAVQQKLGQNLANLKDQASTQFNDLDKAVGTNRVDVTGNIKATAQRIVMDNQRYYEAHPELTPKQAWKIVNDLASDNEGRMSWTDLHQLRTDLLDFYRNSPEVIKSRSDAWIQQLASKTDEAMNSASARLSPAQKAQFRSANATWEQVKSTYDNPQHPFFFALRTGTPEQALSTLINNRNPSMISQVRGATGDLYPQLQRAFVDQLLTKDPSGGGRYELGGLHTRISRIPGDALNAVLGEDGARRLKLLGKTSQIVTARSNPSGTAQATVPFLEGLNLMHNPVAGAAELGAAYGTGRALTSQGVIDYMTRPGPGQVRPGAGGMIPLSVLLNRRPAEEDQP